jgi:hypothetical protein
LRPLTQWLRPLILFWHNKKSRSATIYLTDIPRFLVPSLWLGMPFWRLCLLGIERWLRVTVYLCPGYSVYLCSGYLEAEPLDKHSQAGAWERGNYFILA